MFDGSFFCYQAFRTEPRYRNRNSSADSNDTGSIHIMSGDESLMREIELEKRNLTKLLHVDGVGDYKSHVISRKTFFCYSGHVFVFVTNNVAPIFFRFEI